MPPGYRRVPSGLGRDGTRAGRGARSFDGVRGPGARDIRPARGAGRRIPAGTRGRRRRHRQDAVRDGGPAGGAVRLGRLPTTDREAPVPAGRRGPRRAEPARGRRAAGRRAGHHPGVRAGGDGAPAAAPAGRRRQGQAGGRPARAHVLRGGRAAGGRGRGVRACRGDRGRALGRQCHPGLPDLPGPDGTRGRGHRGGHRPQRRDAAGTGREPLAGLRAGQRACPGDPAGAADP